MRLNYLLVFIIFIYQIHIPNIGFSQIRVDKDGNSSTSLVKDSVSSIAIPKHITNIAKPLNVSCSPIFFDGFESNNYNNWTLLTKLTPTITTNNPAVGNYSLRGYGGYPMSLYSLYNGLVKYISNSTPSEISWYIKPEGTGAANYFVVGDGNVQNDNGVLFCYWNGANNSIRFYNSSGFDIPASPNNWYFIQIKNINWVAHTFDIYINDVLQRENYAFRNPLNRINTIHIFNYDIEYANWDNIRLTNCLPCPENLTIENISQSSGIYESSNTINSAANISNATIYSAGKAINLEKGFTAGPNETFKAEIGGCF